MKEAIHPSRQKFIQAAIALVREQGYAATSVDDICTRAGIDLGLSELVKATLGTVLTAAAPALDKAVGNVLAALGLRLGEADVRVHGLVCQRAVLVQ